MPHSHRLKQVRSILDDHQAQGIIISKKENIFYLTGLAQTHPQNREALLFIGSDTQVLYHSSFLIPPSSKSLTNICIADLDLKSCLSSVFSAATRIIIESHDLTVNELSLYRRHLPRCRFLPQIAPIEPLRLTKDAAEVKALRRSGQISARAYRSIRPWIKQNAGHITELQIARRLHQLLLDFGADDIAFPIIVAADTNSALPHHLPNQTPIRPGSVVLLDFGCRVDHYCSDISRTFCLSTPPPQFIKIRQTVTSAYQTTIDLLHSSANSLSASSLDKAARSIITQAGFAKQFTHTTGHGLGLEIHEAPSLNAQNRQPIQPHMVFTIEPGIYLPGRFGYRHEDTVLTTPAAPFVLTA